MSLLQKYIIPLYHSSCDKKECWLYGKEFKKEVDLGVDSCFFCFSYMILVCDLTFSKIQLSYL